MGDQKEAPVVPAISYEDGISTIRISSKDLPQRPQIDHVIKSSTIPRKPPGEAPSMPLEGATQSSSSLTSTDPVIINGPSVGSIRVSTLDRPKGVSKPSTFEPLSSPAKSSSTERLTAPESVAPVSSLEMINPSFDEPVQSTPASTPASIIIPRVNIKNDKKTPVHKDSNGSIPKETPKGLSTVSEEGSDDKDVTDDAKPVPPVVTPAPSALRKSSDEERAAKKNRKVSWNEHVVVTPDSTSEPSIIELQPEDHEYSPVGESSTPRQNAPNGDILHTGLDGEEFKGYDLLNTDPMFSLEESDNKQKWMLIVLFVLFIIVTIAAVVMGVLYGLSRTTNYDGQVSNLRDALNLMEPGNMDPFPFSWSVDTDTGTYILVGKGERMVSQQPSANAVIAWYKGKRLKVTVRDASGVVQETVHLGDPLGSSSSRLSLLMDNNHFYEAEPADGEYCLVSIMAASDTSVTWTPDNKR